MRHPSSLWAALLIILGALLLLNKFGLLPFDLGAAFWPLLLVLAGLWILVGSIGGKREMSTEAVSVPLEGAGQAVLRLHLDDGTQ